MNITAYMSPGHGKEESEDRILVYNTILGKGGYETSYPRDYHGFIAIFDGVGGLNGGAEASAFAAEQVRCYQGPADPYTLRECLFQIGMKLFNGFQNATTATGILVSSNKVLLFHVGNTRVFALSDEFLERITDDQTTLEEVFAGQIITPEIRDTYGHEITGCLGGTSASLSDRVLVRDISDSFSKFKKLVFTCDGIHDYIDVGQLEKLVLGEINMQQIVQAARAAGSEDDCSILIVDMEV